MKLSTLSVIAFQIAYVCCGLTCNDIVKCGPCIGNPSEKCIWCSQDEITGSRCQSESYANDNESWCKKEFLQIAIPNTTVTQNQEWQSKLNGLNVQLKPQAIHIKARPGIPSELKMFYKRIEHYPLDVYFLIDYSYTMIDHTQKIYKQANEIYDRLTNFTNNVRFGLGSFVEKPGFPYFDSRTGAISYSFKNLLSLTNDIRLFKEVIQKDHTKEGNYDIPEAGLDALMQVMACEKELDWRNNSRKFIVLFTDSTYHSAGDGKMIGIKKPNDMNCHLSNNEYTKSLELDYPSVSQIKTKAMMGSFSIFFAVLKSVKQEYEALARSIGGMCTELKKDADIANLLVDVYSESVNKIELSYILPPYIEMPVDFDCKSKKGQNCVISNENPVVYINANLTVKFCPEGILNHELDIKILGLSDKLHLTIDIECQCACERVNEKPISPKCSDAGYLQCGLCQCNENRYGDDCRCSGGFTVRDDIQKCKQHQNDSMVCNGNGNCVCGKCEACDSGYSGKFCEFSDSSCLPPKSSIYCYDNGKCEQGRCNCYGNYKGEFCDCEDNNINCIAPYSTEVCSGNGECYCSECICKDKYWGAFCDFCDGCNEKRCKELQGYAYCNYVNNKTFCNEIHNGTDRIDVYLVNRTIMNSPEYSSSISTWCKKDLDDGSFMVFKYDYDLSSYRYNLTIQKEPELPSKAKIYVAVGSAIGSILLIGLLTIIIWKILIDRRDSMEYEKFAKKAEADGFNVPVSNVLYVDPVVKFRNPIHHRSVK